MLSAHSIGGRVHTAYRRHAVSSSSAQVCAFEFVENKLDGSAALQKVTIIPSLLKRQAPGLSAGSKLARGRPDVYVKPDVYVRPDVYVSHFGTALKKIHRVYRCQVDSRSIDRRDRKSVV